MRGNPFDRGRSVRRWYAGIGCLHTTTATTVCALKILPTSLVNKNHPKEQRRSVFNSILLLNSPYGRSARCTRSGRSFLTYLPLLALMERCVVSAFLGIPSYSTSCNLSDMVAGVKKGQNEPGVPHSPSLNSLAPAVAWLASNRCSLGGEFSCGIILQIRERQKTITGVRCGGMRRRGDDDSILSTADPT